MDEFSIRFWGTRGSRSVCKSGYLEFGGSTTCMEVRILGRRFVVDAGSGAPELGAKILAEGDAGATILLTHLHLDHIVGLVAFPPLYKRGFPVQIYAPARPDVGLGAGLSVLFREPFNPIGIESLPSNLKLNDFEAGTTLDFDGIRVRSIRLQHGPTTAGYRFDCAGRSLAIITDYEHMSSEPEAALVEFCSGAGVIVYDAMWCQQSDYESHRGWGHSTWQAGLSLLRQAKAARLVCMHHSPDADDAVLGAREAELIKCSEGSVFARDGDYFTI